MSEPMKILGRDAECVVPHREALRTSFSIAQQFLPSDRGFVLLLVLDAATANQMESLLASKVRTDDPPLFRRSGSAMAAATMLGPIVDALRNANDEQAMQWIDTLEPGWVPTMVFDRELSLTAVCVEEPAR